MIELLDPKDIDPIAYGKGYLFSIKKSSLLPDQRIGWNYCMDYMLSCSNRKLLRAWNAGIAKIYN